MTSPLWEQAASVDDDGAEWAQPSPWNVVKLDGSPLPGRAEVVGGAAARKVDVKTPAGGDGAGITDRGLEPARFKIRVSLWTAKHLEAWEQLVPRLNPRAGKGGLRKTSIYHPALATIGVSEVCIASISALQPGSTAGVWQAEIDCLQWQPYSGKDSTKKVTKGGAPALSTLVTQTGGTSGYTGSGSSFFFPQAVDPQDPATVDFGPGYSLPDGVERPE
jgi:hypothetical protein